MSKVGLVLSGGGAKGAYQVGVMRALLELGVEVDALAGASIGALNGGVLASAPNLAVGTERLGQLWQRLGEIKPLQRHENAFSWKAGIYLTFLVSSGLILRRNPYVMAATSAAKMIAEQFDFETGWDLDKKLLEMGGIKDGALFTDQPIQEMMAEFLDIQQLQQSIPFYVSVFEQEGLLNTSKDVALAELFGIENGGSVFKHVQSLPESQQKDMLLASAALPLLFQSRFDEQGKRFSDGGQGGWIKAQGNTPITPLIEEAGCDYVIVSHLNNAALWHRHDFPETTCVEIRPNPKLDLGMAAMLDFSADKIAMLMAVGYEDTMQQLTRVRDTLGILRDKRVAQQTLNQQMAQLDKSGDEMDEAMKLLS